MCSTAQPGNVLPAHLGALLAANCRLARVFSSKPASYRSPKLNVACLCYKFLMMMIAERWLLFKYVDGQFTPLSKPFKTKAAAEKARLKLPERERGTIGVGLIKIKK